MNEPTGGSAAGIGRASAAEASLSKEQLVELLAVLPASDSVELKLTVPESQHRSTVTGLGMDPLEAQIRQVVFFDTPDLALDGCGVVVRARRVQGKGDDSVVKLRPVAPSELPPATRSAAGFNVEVDAVPGGFVCSGTMKRLLDPGPKSVKSVLEGSTRVSKLFSKRQRQLFAAHAPDGLELDDLVALGPIFVLKLRFTPAEFQHRLVAEVWHYPDGSRVLELSTKTTPDDAFPLAARLRAFLGDNGIELSGSQQTKTRKALEFFAAALKDDDVEGRPTPAAAPIVPRWEWRTFGAGLQLPDSAAGILEPGAVAESAEVYLLSRQGDASVKMRDSTLDVKRLERVADNGLEQWRPVLKAPLPLSSEDAETVLDALGLSPDQVDGEPRDVDGLMSLLGRDDAIAARVHKVRRRFKGAGCSAELTTLTVGEHTVHTIAIESEDAAAVTALVDRLGFALQPNVSMARGLKELIGFGGARYGVIDVGTNSVKLHVAEGSAERGWTTVVDRSEITRLGEGLDGTDELQPEPMRRTLEAIAGMVDEAHRLGATAIVAVGTAGMRLASNRGAFVEAVRTRTGVEIEVISGEEESRLAYLAVREGVGLGEGSVVVFDTGGGSSQFTFGTGDRVDERFSVNVGAVRFTERFALDDAVSEDVVASAQAAIAENLASLDGRARPDAVVALGGVVTNLAAVKHDLATYNSDVVQGTVLERAEVDRQIELYRTRTADERREVVGLQPKRAEVVLAGACIVRVAMEKLGSESLVVSDRGLRHGVLSDRFGPGRSS
jgi:exopolyphosphatase/guanosine-5'-triphosphate,3'-diphosphate pyrophosphatase